MSDEKRTKASEERLVEGSREFTEKRLRVNLLAPDNEPSPGPVNLPSAAPATPPPPVESAPATPPADE